LRRAYHDGQDLDAREDMALAALLSGVCLTNAGLGAVHGFASPLGARCSAPHGTICAALLPGVLAANIAALQRAPEGQAAAGLERYATIGRTLAGNASLSPAAALRACVETAQALVAELQIPRLGQFGIGEQDIPELVATAQKANSMRSNPVALPVEVLSEILRQVL
jgi:alcohol dehydrogenase class IV